MRTPSAASRISVDGGRPLARARASTACLSRGVRRTVRRSVRWAESSFVIREPEPLERPPGGECGASVEPRKRRGGKRDGGRGGTPRQTSHCLLIETRQVGGTAAGLATRRLYEPPKPRRRCRRSTPRGRAETAGAAIMPNTVFERTTRPRTELAGRSRVDGAGRSDRRAASPRNDGCRCCGRFGPSTGARSYSNTAFG